MLTGETAYDGLRSDSPVFLTKKGHSWRSLSFNPKKYRDIDGRIKITMVFGSLENLIRELIKGSGLHFGSSHSGRRSLATWLDRQGHSLELIQQILGHKTADMTLVYIEPWDKRIKEAFDSTWSGLSVPIGKAVC